MPPRKPGLARRRLRSLQRQIGRSATGPESGPSGPQSIGAQLHHQPTPGAVQNAESKANADAAAAFDSARRADAAGDADGCRKALEEARRLYGIN